ncbi:hypothetical protein ACGF12_35965 [Kitasatospora sp. NPDC048296]|uniref:hypothetical protein n=1 Tax=Kitasatospora sp. NPDC048296 TaxID=3364048 RepID=UPI003717AC81
MDMDQEPVAGGVARGAGDGNAARAEGFGVGDGEDDVAVVGVVVGASRVGHAVPFGVGCKHHKTTGGRTVPGRRRRHQINTMIASQVSWWRAGVVSSGNPGRLSSEKRCGFSEESLVSVVCRRLWRQPWSASSYYSSRSTES